MDFGASSKRRRCGLASTTTSTAWAAKVQPSTVQSTTAFWLDNGNPNNKYQGTSKLDALLTSDSTAHGGGMLFSPVVLAADTSFWGATEGVLLQPSSWTAPREQQIPLQQQQVSPQQQQSLLLQQNVGSNNNGMASLPSSLNPDTLLQANATRKDLQDSTVSMNWNVGEPSGSECMALISSSSFMPSDIFCSNHAESAQQQLSTTVLSHQQPPSPTPPPPLQQPRSLEQPAPSNKLTVKLDTSNAPLMAVKKETDPSTHQTQSSHQPQLHQPQTPHQTAPRAARPSNNANASAASSSSVSSPPSTTASTASTTVSQPSTESASKDLWFQRPDVDSSGVSELNKIERFLQCDKYTKLLVDYRDGISFPLGEGGRELLRACLNAQGCKGRRLQGASVPVLLQLAHEWGLWPVAMRIKIERYSGELCPQHDAFVRFKAIQSQMRKFVRREFMHVDKDNSGRIQNIQYEDSKVLPLGKEGREVLRAQLRRLHDKQPRIMDELLDSNGFKYSELRNATVAQLIKMARVCNIWDGVVEAYRKQDEKKSTGDKKNMGAVLETKEEPSSSGSSTAASETSSSSSSDVSTTAATTTAHATSPSPLQGTVPLAGALSVPIPSSVTLPPAPTPPRNVVPDRTPMRCRSTRDSLLRGGIDFRQAPGPPIQHMVVVPPSPALCWDTAVGGYAYADTIAGGAAMVGTNLASSVNYYQPLAYPSVGPPTALLPVKQEMQQRVQSTMAQPPAPRNIYAPQQQQHQPQPSTSSPFLISIKAELPNCGTSSGASRSPSTSVGNSSSSNNNDDDNDDDDDEEDEEDDEDDETEDDDDSSSTRVDTGSLDIDALTRKFLASSNVSADKELSPDCAKMMCQLARKFLHKNQK